MKVTMSKFLTDHKHILKQLIELLSKDFPYVSILGTDVYGKRYAVQGTGVTIEDSRWTERGFVVRVHNGVNYTEFSFNDIGNETAEELRDKIRIKINESLNGVRSMSMNAATYDMVHEEEMRGSYIREVGKLPDAVSAGEKIRLMTEFRDSAMGISKFMVDFKVTYEEVYVSKIFISGKKDLEQAYIWSQGYLMPIIRRGDNTKFFFTSFSGLKGPELLDEMKSEIKYTVETAEKLLDADPVEPGEYDIICSPEISGLIAHEAFGHGVEMDMFVKKRAKALEYLGKPVASELVTMHDGAASEYEVASYFFDDEGMPGTDTVVIKDGILKTGISDLLSALRLGTKPTGNGRRESYERKAYARMTNTFFEAGNDSLEDMIASIKHGYLLDGTMSGMEDPKNWGIQCMLILGHEIKDGKLTGRIISPVIMTGYVPDLLKSITMVSDGVKMFGSGACGKGYKEYVKVSDGGPYIKTRGRLG